jgi:hypothetical protein
MNLRMNESQDELAAAGVLGVAVQPKADPARIFEWKHDGPLLGMGAGPYSLRLSVSEVELMIELQGVGLDERFGRQEIVGHSREELLEIERVVAFAEVSASPRPGRARSLGQVRAGECVAKVAVQFDAARKPIIHSAQRLDAHEGHGMGRSHRCRLEVDRVGVEEHGVERQPRGKEAGDIEIAVADGSPAVGARGRAGLAHEMQDRSRIEPAGKPERQRPPRIDACDQVCRDPGKQLAHERVLVRRGRRGPVGLGVRGGPRAALRGKAFDGEAGVLLGESCAEQKKLQERFVRAKAGRLDEARGGRFAREERWHTQFHTDQPGAARGGALTSYISRMRAAAAQE